MTTVCQVFDRDTSTVLFDLNDPTGASALDNGYSSTQLFQTVNLGTPTWQHERFEPPQRDGGSTTFKRAGFRQVTIPLRMRSTSIDNMLRAVGRLNQYLQAGCTIRFRMDGATLYQYILVEPSTTTYFVDGRELGLHDAAIMLDTPSGIQLSLTAQPFLEGDELVSSSNLFTNATMLIDADGAGRPDGWGWSSTANITNEAIVAADEAFRYDIAVAANRSLTESTGAATAAVGEVWTLSGYARVTSASMTNARTEAMLTWRTSAPADISTITSGLVTLTTAWQRIAITGTAPATTDRIQAGPRQNNTSATSATVEWRNWQIEKAPAATPFHVGTEAGDIDPDPTSGIGRVFPIYNPGDAPAEVRVKGRNTTTSYGAILTGLATNALGTGAGRQLTTLLNGATIVQSEAGTNGTDTAVDTDTDSSPGSGNTGKLTTFVTTTDQTRITHSITSATTLAAWRGRTFRAQARVTARTSTYTGAIHMRTTIPGTQGSIDYPDATLTAAIVDAYYEVFLGYISFPDVAMEDATILLRASRTAGTGNLVWDYLELVPVEASGFLDIQGAQGTTVYTVSDPRLSRWGYEVVSTGLESGFTGTVVPITSGPVPVVIPPGLSLLYYAPSHGFDSHVTEPGLSSHAITDATQVALEFTPRYL